MSHFIDLAGKHCGHFDVLAIADTKTYPSGWTDTKWAVRCVCGRELTVSGKHLRSGKSTNCGCVALANFGASQRTHGRSKTAEYNSWRGMHDRCTNPNHISYRLYGARGIVICEAWKDFATFLRDMGMRPTPKHSLDRIDSNGAYAPENCRWATDLEQARNSRHASVRAWDIAAAEGVQQRTIYGRRRRIAKAAAK